MANFETTTPGGEKTLSGYHIWEIQDLRRKAKGPRSWNRSPWQYLTRM